MMAESPPRRVRGALRVLARRRSLLAALAGTALALTLALVVLLAGAWVVAATLPAPWGAVALVVALVLYLPLLAAGMRFVEASVRAVTLFATRPLPDTPQGILGAFGGLGLFLFGRRLRVRRAPWGWFSDPLGSAAGVVLRRALPPDHPLAALLQIQDHSPGRSPLRGAWTVPLGVLLGGVLVAMVASILGGTAWGWSVGVLLVPLVPAACVLAGATRGALAAAWDRVLVERWSAETQSALDAASSLFGGSRQVPPSG